MLQKSEVYSFLGSSKRTISTQVKKQLNIFTLVKVQLLTNISNSKWGTSIKQV